MTRSLSNVIKAAAVTYTQEIRTIDSNLREGGFTRLAVEKRAQVKRDGEEDGEFKPGILGLFAQQDKEEKAEDEEALEIARKKEEAEQKIKEAQDMLLQAREEAENILSAAQTDADGIRKQAYDDGLRQGEKKAQEKYDTMKVRLEREVKEAKEAYERQVRELEPAFVEILIHLMGKLTGVLLEEKSDLITYLIEQALYEIGSSMTYLVHVSPEDFAVANLGKEKLLAQLKEGAVLEITKDGTMQKGQCIIETDSRIFDCSIDVQLKNLAGDLKMLAGSREE